MSKLDIDQEVVETVGIRFVGTQSYWDMGPIYSANSIKRISARATTTRAKAMKAWERYRLAQARMKLAPVELVTHYYRVAEEAVASPDIEHSAWIEANLQVKCGMAIANTYRIMVNRNEDWPEYKFVIRRKRGEKQIIALSMENNFSHGAYTFCRDEKELVMAQLILSEEAEVYSLEFPQTQCSS